MKWIIFCNNFKRSLAKNSLLPLSMIPNPAVSIPLSDCRSRQRSDFECSRRWSMAPLPLREIAIRSVWFEAVGQRWRGMDAAPESAVAPARIGARIGARGDRCPRILYFFIYWGEILNFTFVCIKIISCFFFIIEVRFSFSLNEYLPEWPFDLYYI